jgi:hypothetical protein
MFINSNNNYISSKRYMQLCRHAIKMAYRYAGKGDSKSMLMSIKLSEHLLWMSEQLLILESGGAFKNNKNNSEYNINRRNSI